MSLDVFKGTKWREEIDVRDFIQENFIPYLAEPTFLAGPTPRTRKLWEKCSELLWQEVEKGGVLDVDVDTVADINAYEAGYIDKDAEIIVGLQTDAPLKRTLNVYGGIRMARQAAEAYGYKVNPRIEEIFTKYRKNT